MPLQDRIITYVTKCNGLVSLDKLVAVSNTAGFSESETLAALERIGSKLKSSVCGGTVYYQVPLPPKPTSTSHVTWLHDNYPTPPQCEHGKRSTACKHCKPFPEISYSHLFLSPEEMKEYKAAAKGLPLHMYNKRDDKKKV